MGWSGWSFWKGECHKYKDVLWWKCHKCQSMWPVSDKTFIPDNCVEKGNVEVQATNGSKEDN